MHEEERKGFVNCKDASRMNIHCRTVVEEKCFGGEGTDCRIFMKMVRRFGKECVCPGESRMVFISR